MQDAKFDGKNGADNVLYDLASNADLQAAIASYFKAVAPATAALKAIYTDLLLDRFRPDFNHILPGRFGALTAVSLADGHIEHHIANNVMVSTSA